MRSARMAIYPMLLAERDWEYLKQLRRNRDAEAELMRDVPGWEVRHSQAKLNVLLVQAVSKNFKILNLFKYAISLRSH